ncbi:MAG: glycosyltransferase family 2 protein [Geminicoccaceae bacterium]
MAEPTVSAVVTVYNKAEHVTDTIRSIRGQIDDETDVEYVFVDDASTDGSMEVVARELRGAPNQQLIWNEDNRGPSVRLNQGGRSASGRYLYFLDADDLALRGVVAEMRRLLDHHDADLIYGRSRRFFDDRAPDPIPAVDRAAPVEVSDQALRHVMRGGFVRMTCMCERDLFHQAGGADETVFIQDESLPIRLAANARRLVDWRTPVMLQRSERRSADIKARGSHLSDDKAQMHHDGFLAFRNAIQSLAGTHADLTPDLYRRALSCYWKHVRASRPHPWLHPAFWHYLKAKGFRLSPDQAVLDAIAADFARVPGLRRIQA